MTNSIAAMNERGAGYLLANRLQEAQLCFHRALEVVLQFQSPLRATMGACDFVDKLLDGPHPAPLKEALNSTAADSHGYLFTKPFFFNQQIKIYSLQDLSSYGAIISFNLALSYHLQSQLSRDGGCYLASAQKFYDKTLELLVSELRYECSNLIVATLNNLACLQVDRNEQATAYENLRLMTYYLTGSNGSPASNASKALAPEDLRGVVLNTRALMLPSCAGTA